MPGVADILYSGVSPDRAKALCVFVHGRNQGPEDMLAQVIRDLQAPDVAFALPRADQACWYHALAVAPRSPQTEAELALSLRDLAALIRRLRAAAPGRPLLLAGFSQGACLSLELAFSGQDSPDALAALTGCRVGAASDARPVAVPAGLPVYLTGAEADPWIPLRAYAEAAEALARAGAQLRAQVFARSTHEVSAAERAVLSAMLADLVAGRPVLKEPAP